MSRPCTPLAERMASKYRIEGSVSYGSHPCWTWTAHRNNRGYAMVGAGGKFGRMILAHRASYELANGPIPDGLIIDHLCRNRACINPKHLEPVDYSTNALRGESGWAVAARQRAKTHCPKGHEYSPINTYIDKGGKRSCKRCWSERDTSSYRARKNELQRARRAAKRAIA